MAVETIREKVLLSGLEKEVLILNPYVAWSVLVAYLSFTKFFGPTIMKNRKPFDLQWLMILFNAVLVASNVFLSVRLTQFVYVLWPYRCNVYASPLVKEPEAYFPVVVVCFYVKFAELFDTVLFILRKKFSQVSFLHVFHHAVVFLMAWICFRNSFIKFHLVLVGAVNCSVHVLLYLYYGLSALGPSVRKHLWWKKYLTKLQIVQFFVLMFYMSYSMLTGCEKFSKFDNALFCCILIITVLFFNFYFQQYNKRKTTAS